MKPKDIQKFQNISENRSWKLMAKNTRERFLFNPTYEVRTKKLANSFVWKQRGGRKTFKKYT